MEKVMRRNHAKDLYYDPSFVLSFQFLRVSDDSFNLKKSTASIMFSVRSTSKGIFAKLCF